MNKIDIIKKLKSIAGIQSSVESQGSRLDTAEGNITSQGTRLDTAEGNITSIQSSIGTLQTTVGGLTKAVVLKAIVDNYDAIETWYSTNSAEKTVGDAFIVKVDGSDNNAEYVYIEDGDGNGSFEKLGVDTVASETISITSESFASSEIEGQTDLFVATVTPTEGSNFDNIKSATFMVNGEEEFCEIKIESSTITITNDEAVNGVLVLNM